MRGRYCHSRPFNAAGCVFRRICVGGHTLCQQSPDLREDLANSLNRSALSSLGEVSKQQQHLSSTRFIGQFEVGKAAFYSAASAVNRPNEDCTSCQNAARNSGASSTSCQEGPFLYEQ